MKNHRTVIVAIATVLLGGGTLASTSPERKCQSDKNKTAGSYDYCRQKVEAQFVTTDDELARATGLERCQAKYDQKWASIESRAAGSCPSAGDQGAIRAAIDEATANLATALAGMPLVGCPGLLVACEGEPRGQPLATAQTGCWDSNGVAVPCAGTGQDGGLQKGRSRSYVGTAAGIVDTQTALMSHLPFSGTYTWDGALMQVAALNTGGGSGGYTDWRLPNVNELRSLVLYGTWNPAVPAEFSFLGSGGGLFTSHVYWSSTTSQRSSYDAWAVNFDTGQVSDFYTKNQDALFVLSVRRGS
jgi:hypothetical protein